MNDAINQNPWTRLENKCSEVTKEDITSSLSKLTNQARKDYITD